MRTVLCGILLFVCLASFPLHSANQATTIISEVTPSVIAVGMKTPIASSSSQIMGTGFVIGDGTWAVTNYHVVNKELDPTIVQYYVVLAGRGTKVKEFRAEVVQIDPVHDIALLKLNGALPALSLAPDAFMLPGQDILFTGFPIGAILGLYPATHKGMLAAISPDAIPAYNADQLTLSLLKRLKKPELIYQLDATAYPGNSGSPVYTSESGDVVAIINKVMVKGTKESALSSPSGISYAVPVKHIRALAAKEGLAL